MKKENLNTLLIFILNFVTIMVLAHENVFSNTIAISTDYITYNTLVATILFIILVIMKFNVKVVLITNLSRLSFERTMTLFAFVFFYISFISVFMFTGQLDFLIGLILIMCEIVLMISMLIISANISAVSLNNKFLKLKDIIFILLVLDLILKNQPFEFFAVPIDTMLIASYTTLCMYILYKIISLLKESY